MTPQVSQYLNKAILISIPTLFGDAKCRACTLVGAELQGLWLQSDDLMRRLLAADHGAMESAAPVIFVPFAQIAGVVIPTQVPASLAAPLAMQEAHSPPARARKPARARRP